MASASLTTSIRHVLPANSATGRYVMGYARYRGAEVCSFGWKVLKLKNAFLLTRGETVYLVSKLLQLMLLPICIRRS